MTQSRAYLFVTLGAALWGCVGVFVNGLSARGVSAIQIASLRMVGGTAVLLVWMIRSAPHRLQLRRPADVRLFILTGAVSIAVFQWSYLSAIRSVGMSAAVVLLYTSPGFVVIFARLLFGERITGPKIFCLLAMFLGVVAVSGVIGGDSGARLSVQGTILGLLAGLSFSLYTVVGKYALQRYGAQTVTVYTFAAAAIALTPAVLIDPTPFPWSSFPVYLWAAGIIAVPTVGAYMVYAMGLSHVESGRAAIVGTVEVLVAVVIGVLFFGDHAGASQLAGTALIVAAALGVRASAPISRISPTGLRRR